MNLEGGMMGRHEALRGPVEGLDTLLPAQFSVFLAQDGSKLQRDDWRDLFYDIEEMAENGHSGRAMELLQVCLSFADRGSDEWANSSVRHFLGNVHMYRGEFDAAVQAYEWVVRQGACADGDVQAAALAYTAISGARMGQGRLPEAIAAAEQALALDQRQECIASQMEDMLSLANLYLTNEDFAQAEDMVAAAIRLAETVRDRTYAVKVDGRYLIERNAVCYSPSASVMKYCHAKRKGRRQNALVVGDPLGDLWHAQEEAWAVANLFGSEPLIGDAAKKAEVMSLSNENGEQFDILHFACHGRLDREQPLRSGIVLASDGQDANDVDGLYAGRLTAEEILQLRLKADLVTLSACDSGVNERRPGDELIGLTRSLLYAGTPSVLVSLWAAHDFPTRLLMEKFYLELRNSTEENPVTKAQALRIAQRYVMNLPLSRLAEVYETRSRPQGGDMPDATERRLRDLSDAESLNRERATKNPNAKAFGHPCWWAIGSNLPGALILLESSQGRTESLSSRRLPSWLKYER